MTIQPILLDAVKQMAIGKIDTIVVTPDGPNTLFSTFDPDQYLILTGKSHEPVEGVVSPMGLYNFKVMRGLLTSPAFMDPNANIEIGLRDGPEGAFPETINFKGKGSKAVFRLMAKTVLPAQPELGNIPWDISILDTDSKFSSFQHMASLYGEVDSSFRLRTEEGNLVAEFGSNSGSTHAATMVLQEDVGVDITGEIEFDIAKFLLMLKTASGAKAMDVKVLSRGLMGIDAVTDHGVYTYILKKNMV